MHEIVGQQLSTAVVVQEGAARDPRKLCFSSHISRSKLAFTWSVVSAIAVLLVKRKPLHLEEHKSLAQKWRRPKMMMVMGFFAQTCSLTPTLVLRLPFGAVLLRRSAEHSNGVQSISTRSQTIHVQSKPYLLTSFTTVLWSCAPLLCDSTRT